MRVGRHSRACRARPADDGVHISDVAANEKAGASAPAFQSEETVENQLQFSIEFKAAVMPRSEKV